jgi:4'-phosphopantetheinyl transferase EntD
MGGGTGLIGAVLPPCAAAVEAVGDRPGAALLPAEAAALGRVCARRRRDFTLGRTCARQALAEIGAAARPVLPGPAGEPCWPPECVGSLTHCDGYAAAAVAYRSALWTVGIDAEPNRELPVGVLDRIAFGPELRWLRTRWTAGVCWDRLLFSIKESVYKAWFPVTGRWLGFADASVTVDDTRQDSGTFRARLLVPAPRVGDQALAWLDGRYAVRDGLLVTAVAVPVTGVASR